MQRLAVPPLLLGVCLAFPLAAGAETASYDRVDAPRSTIRMRIPVWGGLVEIDCLFTDYSATIVWDEIDPTRSAVAATIVAASLDTGSADRNARMRSAEFFDVTRYPEIVFRSRAIERRAAGFVALGDLTLHGVTRPIELDFALVGAPEKSEEPRGALSVHASATLDRDEFKVGGRRDRPPFVGSRIEIEIRLLARRAESGATVTAAAPP